MERIYLDYAASTGLDPEVERAMRPYFAEKFGNPGSLHSFGQEASAAVDESRAKIARLLGLDILTGFREIIFTGSATEANNLALRGVLKVIIQNVKIKNQNDADFIEHSRQSRNNLKLKNNPPSVDTAILHFDICNLNFRPRIIISTVEHESILATVRDLEKEGVEVVYAPVTREGVVDLEKFKKLLNDRTVLVSVMYVNNETGMMQPIAEISKLISEFRIWNLESGKKNSEPKFQIPNSKFYPLLHVDASQAPHVLDCNPQKLGVDLMTLSGHKIYGPKGIGLLYARNAGSVRNVVNGKYNKRAQANGRTPTTFITPILTGANQEFGLRAGTENVPAIVGCAKALELAVEKREETVKHLQKLQKYFCRGIKKIFPRAQFNGFDKLTTSGIDSAKNKTDLQKSPHIVSIYLPGFYSHDLLVALDIAGIAVSAGSACSSRHSEPSYVLQAMGYSKKRAQSSLRFSFGRPTTEGEVKKALLALGKILKK